MSSVLIWLRWRDRDAWTAVIWVEHHCYWLSEQTSDGDTKHLHRNVHRDTHREILWAMADGGWIDSHWIFWFIFAGYRIFQPNRHSLSTLPTGCWRWCFGTETDVSHQTTIHNEVKIRTLCDCYERWFESNLDPDQIMINESQISEAFCHHTSLTMYVNLFSN